MGEGGRRKKKEEMKKVKMGKVEIKQGEMFRKQELEDQGKTILKGFPLEFLFSEKKFSFQNSMTNSIDKLELQQMTSSSQCLKL